MLSLLLVILCCLYMSCVSVGIGAVMLLRYIYISVCYGVVYIRQGVCGVVGAMMVFKYYVVCCVMYVI